jgi:hypothetical protein
MELFFQCSTLGDDDITLFSHVGRFHDLGIYQLYSMGPLQQIKIHLLTFKLTLGNLGRVVLLALFNGMIFHTGTIVCPNIIY